MPSIRTNLMSVSRAQSAVISTEYPPKFTKMLTKNAGIVVMIGF